MVCPITSHPGYPALYVSGTLQGVPEGWEAEEGCGSCKGVKHSLGREALGLILDLPPPAG